MDRIILHCDMNSFFASVELLEHPELKNKPMAVCGNPENRHGIILAKNELAKSFGVVTAETISSAIKKCPTLALISPHMEKYKFFCNKINRIYMDYTDMVEPYSIDESWLDVTGSQKLFGTGKEIADTIRERVKMELGLTLSAGVSYNKIFAKMGSDYKKPNATTVITRGNYKNILWPISVGEMFFVGKATENKLNSIGIMTIGDLAESDPKVLKSLLGKQGELIYNYSNGYDNSPVNFCNQKNKIKTVGNGITFKRNLVTTEDILTAVTSLSDKVAGRLRKYGLKAFGVKLDIKDPYFKTISRQQQLDMPTNLAENIRTISLNILNNSWNKSDPIRLLTITAINLQDESQSEQISIFSELSMGNENGEKIERTMDTIRKRFGNSSITFAQIIGNDLGIDLYDEEEK